MTAAHSTCYRDAFITVAPGGTVATATVPPARQNPSVAARTYDMIASAPYRYTSDEVIFTVWADRRDIPASERDRQREAFFAKPQACLRSSDLGKKYGWGIHSDDQGRVALYGVGTADYERFAAGVCPLTGQPVSVTAAMRSSRR